MGRLILKLFNADMQISVITIVASPYNDSVKSRTSNYAYQEIELGKQ